MALRRLFVLFVTPILMSLGASLATAPIIYLWFGIFVPLSPIINAAIVHLFSFLGIGTSMFSLILWISGVPGSELIVRFSLGIIELFLELLNFALECSEGSVFAFREYGAAGEQ